MSTQDAPTDLWGALGRWQAEQDADCVGIVRRWLEMDGEPTGQGLGRYLHRLEDRGLKGSTMNRAYTTIRRFCDFAGLPRPRVSWWHYDSEEADRPWFDVGAVAKLAGVARKSPVATDAARFCLSSLYGMRVGEISRVRPEDVRLEDGRVFIRSLKGSRRRWCWIPPEARPWLDVRWQPTAPRSVSAVLDALWEQTFAERRPKGAAWHAVRRGVAYSLHEAGCSEEAVERFLRWKNSRSMVRLYTHPNVRVGAEGTAERVTEEDEGSEGADREVWSTHPFRELWR